MPTVPDTHHARRQRPVRAAALAAALAALAFGLLAGQARAVEPIEGTWDYQSGQVLVEPTTPGNFKGTVVVPTTFSACTHPVGQVMWAMSGSGTHYEGTHTWFTAACSENAGGASTWDIINTDPSNFQLNFCTQEPGSGPVTPSTSCNTLTRSKPPIPPASDVIKFPSAKKCVSKRKFRIRIKRPNDIVLDSGKVSLNGKQVQVLRKKILGKKRLTATINLRGLKKGTFKVKISVVTSTGDTIKGSRKYKTCRKGQKPKRSPKL